jgi:hypothetical protein
VNDVAAKEITSTVCEGGLSGGEIILSAQEEERLAKMKRALYILCELTLYGKRNEGQDEENDGWFSAWTR